MSALQTVADILRLRTAAVKLNHLQVPREVADALRRDLARSAIHVIDGHHPLPRIDDCHGERLTVARAHMRHQFATATGGGVCCERRFWAANSGPTSGDRNHQTCSQQSAEQRTSHRVLLESAGGRTDSEESGAFNFYSKSGGFRFKLNPSHQSA